MLALVSASTAQPNAMFVVHTHPVYQRRSRRLPSYDPFGFERPAYTLSPEPTLGDPVQLARDRYLHALEEQQAAREAYAVHQLRAFEAAAFLQHQQQRRRQAAIEEAQRARREQLIQARREEELRLRRLQEVQDDELSQALMLAFELASQVGPRHVEHAPAHPACACAHGHARRTVRPAPAAAPAQSTSVPIGHTSSRPIPAFQPRVRFSPTESSTRAPAPTPSKPAAAPVTLKSALKPTTPPAPIRIGIRESKAGPSSSTSAPTPLQPAAPSTSVRIPIRESKGKASSQVRINVVSTPAPHALAPADAIAALSLLEADLGALTSSTTSAPLLRHQLNGILESVDAIESGGHDAVREVRRALVRRIEEALVAVEQGDASVAARPQRAVGITINEPSSTSVEVKASAQSAASAAAETTAAPSETAVVESIELASAAEEAPTPPATADVVPVLEGYVVDDFLDPTPAVPSSSTPLSASQPVAELSLAVPEPAEPGSVAELASAPPTPSDGPAAEELIARADETLLPAAAATNNDLISFDAASAGVDAASSPAAAAPDQPASLPATSDESSSYGAASESTGSQPAAKSGSLAAAPVAAVEPTSRAFDEPASPTPDETPLAASYPPAQTFAAPTHPAVDTGSDGEWERPGSSGSEGAKSDYEVV